VIRLAAFFVLAWLSTAAAVQPGEQFADPALEARARAISAGLRCLVCQNQSIDESDAPLARDLRLLVRERLSAGEGDEEVRAYLVARYGDFILLQPPFSAATILLWLTPLLVLACGAIYLMLNRRAAAQNAGHDLSREEEARLKELLQARD
jgi:cytochrome c-type biogenesis protein CcmH